MSVWALKHQQIMNIVICDLDTCIMFHCTERRKLLKTSVINCYYNVIVQ